jgi:hypothetical protein
MACYFLKIDKNGQIRQSPVHTRVIQYLDNKIRNNEQILGTDVQSILVDAGIMGLFVSKVNISDGLDNIQDIVELNAILEFNYGAKGSAIRLTPVEGKRGLEIIAQIDENVLNQISPVAAPTFSSERYAYEFAMEQKIRSEGWISPVIQYTGDPRVKVIADPQAIVKMPNEVARNTKPVFNPSLLDIAIEESKVTKERVASILARLEQDAKDSRVIDANETRVAIDDISGQINKMKTAFEKAGVPVQIDIDTDLEVKGRVINEKGKILTIKLNPVLMTEDTHIHEFAHILIDLLGEDNPVVARALKEVRNTNLYDKVREKYPELDPKQLDFEVLVTAIGLAGAKFNRNNPNKLQQLVNRLLRALSKVFGLESNTSAVEELAQSLLQGRIDKSMFEGKTISFLMADSKQSVDENKKKFEEILQDSRIAIEESIAKIKRKGESADLKAAARLEVLQKRLETAKEVEDFKEFIEYGFHLANRAKDVINDVFEQYSENPEMLSGEQRLEMMHKLQTVGEYVSDFFGAKDPRNSVMGKIHDLIDYKVSMLEGSEDIESNPEFLKLTAIEQKISKAVMNMNKVANKYTKAGIPILVDLLMEYNRPEINDQIDNAIENIKNNQRLIAIEQDAEYFEIKRLQKEKKYSSDKDENDRKAFEALLALNMEQLANKKITRQTLIRELTEAQKDKSAFSYLVDPIIYSSQVGLQMFATMLKDKMYQANDDTREDISKISKAYQAYEKIMGLGIDPNKFNEKILEVHSYRVFNHETGKMEDMRVLSFVQPYDVTRYKSEEQKMYNDLGKTHNKPGETATDEEFSKWAKSSEGKAYYKDVANWYKNNSVPSESAKAELQKLLNEKSAIKNLLEQAKKTKKTDLIAHYEMEFSLINSMISKIYDPVYKQFKYTAVRPNDKYVNPKYANMDAASKEYHAALLDLYKEKQKTLGKGSNQIRNSWDTFSYIVPAVRSTGLEKVQKDGAYSAARDAVKNTFEFLSTDTSYGDAINANGESRNKVIPIFYVNPLDESLTSRDIASTIAQFSGMANMFKRKSEINSAVVMMRDVIENRKPLEVNSANIPIVNKIGKRLGFVKHETKEGVDNNFKHLSEWIDSIFYGEKDLKESLNIFGKEISAAKVANKLASFTALNTLALNLLQSTNQFLIDNVRLVEEGVAGQFMSKENLAYAKKMYYLSANGGLSTLKDFDSFSPESKVVQAIQYFDALGESLSISETRQTGPKALRAVNDIPMGLQKIAEHETAVTRMFGVLDSYKGKLKDKDGNVIKNEQGEDANLWDVFIKNEATGLFEIDPRVANVKKIEVINRLSGLTKKTNQIKTDFDNAMLQRRAGGKLLMLFRRYFVPALRRNFGHNGLRGGVHRDLELGTISEGMFSTFGRYIKETFSKQGGRMNFVSVYKMMEDFEKQNMKRMSVQIGFFILCSLIIMSLSGDDDDDNGYWESFMLYQALRMNSELTQFINPSEFLKLALSPTATARPLQRAIDLFHQVWTTGMGHLTGDPDGLYYERRSGIHEKGDSKLIAKATKLLPIIGGLEKSSDPETAASWFDLGAGNTK